MDRNIYLNHFLDTNTPTYGNSSGFIRKRLRSIAQGDTSNNEYWEFPNHIGTHIDFPYHFVESGGSLQHFDPDFFIVRHIALVHLPSSPGSIIDVAALESSHLPLQTEALLLKTDFEQIRTTEVYWHDNPAFHPQLAGWLRSKCPSLRFLGFDSISLSSWQHRQLGRDAHREFLGTDHPILPIEDMKLSQLSPSSQIKQMTIAPFPVLNADGAPVTVIAKIHP